MRGGGQGAASYLGLSTGVGAALVLLLGVATLAHPGAAHAEGLPTEYIQGFLVRPRGVKSC